MERTHRLKAATDVADQRAELECCLEFLLHLDVGGCDESERHAVDWRRGGAVDMNGSLARTRAADTLGDKRVVEELERVDDALIDVAFGAAEAANPYVELVARGEPALGS